MYKRFYLFYSHPNIQTKLKIHVKNYCKLQSVNFFFHLTLLLFIYFEHKFKLGTFFFEYNRFSILLIAYFGRGLNRIFPKRYSDNKQIRFYSHVISWKGKRGRNKLAHQSKVKSMGIDEKKRLTRIRKEPERFGNLIKH